MIKKNLDSKNIFKKVFQKNIVEAFNKTLINIQIGIEPMLSTDKLINMCSLAEPLGHIYIVSQSGRMTFIWLGFIILNNTFKFVKNKSLTLTVLKQ